MKLYTPVFAACGAALFVAGTLTPASAAPKSAPVSDQWLLDKGAEKEGPNGNPTSPEGSAILWLDEATQSRSRAMSRRAASAGSAEAPVFDQPHDSGFGFFEKTYDETGGLPTWATRMRFGNGWTPGNSLSSYELTIFHSSSDDILFGDADYAVELWDGDPFSILETVCTTGGVSAPIPGTQGIIADVPWGTLIRGRVELPVKVVYDCDRVWMGMTSLNGCRATWRISGCPGAGSVCPPDIGWGNGLWLLAGCESGSVLSGTACPTDTGLGVGFCCGSDGVCDDPANLGSGSQTPCNHRSDCTVPGEACTGREPCDHGSSINPVLCSSTAAGSLAFCGNGLADYYIADIGLPDTERGYVGSIFAATETTMSVVPVSVDELPPSTGPGPGVISLGGDEVVLQEGNHNIWLQIMIGDWDPDDVGVRLGGYQPAIDGIAGFSSGLQGTLEIYTGGAPCGECTDNAAPCFGNAECTSGTCSGSGAPCHVVSDCASGESCDGPAAQCVVTATGHDDCAAALGAGSTCGPIGYLMNTATGTCSWTFSDDSDPRWALRDAISTIAALDVNTIDARPAYAVVVGPPNDPEPFPTGGMYGSTLAVHVPVDARGTFTIGLKPFPRSALNSSSGSPIPLLGTVAGKITVLTGRCCFNLQNLPTGGEGCLDLMTTDTCAQMPGVTLFAPNLTCDEPCDPDCNTNGVPDDRDIADGTSVDCNPNGIPDECELAGNDCNGNGIPDDCDFASCPAGDATCEDCNGNGILDGCDIASCSASDATCNDCNLNGAPDFCDVPAPGGNCTVDCSADVDADGVPDECVSWTGGGDGASFSDPNNFNGPLPGPGDSLTIDAGLPLDLGGSRSLGQVLVDLETSASFDTLRLLNGAVLTAVGAVNEDLTLLGAGGLFLKGDPINVSLASKLLVANDRLINVLAGQVVLAAGGEYTKDPAAPSLVTASLLAASVLVSNGACPCPTATNGGLLELSDEMSLSVSGDIVLMGVSAAGCPCGGSSTAGSQRGINVPPKFRLVGGSTSSATGLAINGTAEVLIDSTGAADPSGAALTLSGNLLNASTDAASFDWSSGLLLLNGTEVQSFEVAGVDFGTALAGFGTPGNTNFSMDRIEIASGSHVVFVNDSVNTASSAPCAEALYVRELTLRAGATVTTSNVNVFYDVLIDEGGTIIEAGCGSLSSLCPVASQPQPDQIAGQDSIKNRFLSFSAGDTGQSQAVRVTFDSLPPPYDLWNGSQLWVGSTSQVSEASADITPSGGPAFTAARLQCAPLFTDWSALGTIHVFHEGIVPGGSYQIDVIGDICDAGLPESFSVALPMTTAIHGDTVFDLSASPPLPPGGPPVGIDDALAILGRFSNVPGAIIKARAELEPACLDLKVNVTDVLASLAGFAGLDYPFSASAVDPCNSTCTNPLP